MTSASRSRASATDARPSRKSPASTAILLPKEILAEGEDLLEVELSITSSCKSEAVCISSVISASRRCEGNMSELSNVSNPDGESGLEFDKGFVSDRIVEGDIGSSIIEAVDTEVGLGALGVVEIALDMRRTIRGRTCFPSDFV